MIDIFLVIIDGLSCDFCSKDFYLFLNCRYCFFVFFSTFQYGFLFRNWKTEGKRKLDIILSCKTIFDKLEADELVKARTRSNPFETIRSGFFLNRAAMKMANMDAVFDFMFTNPVDENGRSLGKRPVQCAWDIII